MIEQIQTGADAERLSDQYNRLLGREPKLITWYVPTDAAAQRKAFLAGEIENPDHTYGKLEKVDFEGNIDHITTLGELIQDHSDLNPKFSSVYEAFASNYAAKTRLARLAHNYKQAKEPTEKARIRAEYMRLNIDLYGAPDERTYQSLLQEKLSAINAVDYSPRGQAIRDELFDLVDFDESAEKIDRFQPSKETVEWMHEVADSLYGGMLARIPDRPTFTVHETQAIFQSIINEEFGEAAADWTVDVEPAKSINVKSTEKRIVIPHDRGNLSRAAIRGLVVHELGVHMLRAVMGGETDLDPLRQGLSDYYDAEEGLGVVMEQALLGKFKEAGVGHYITAGLAYFNNLDFRGVFEAKWRLSVLENAADGRVISELDIAKAKKTAFGATMRSFRGTDELPWFKDLAYYNGSVGVWRHLETIKGDDLMFMFVLMGKADPAKIEHQRVMYETSTY